MNQSSEDLFKKIAQRTYSVVRKSSQKEDIYDHIDFFLEDLSRAIYRSALPASLSVDVKGRKKTSRRDRSPNDDWTWIEFTNVKGHPGWLHGKADYIAFERAEDFMLVNRLELIQFCSDRVNLNTLVQNPYEAEYTGYRRKDRKDLISRVRMRDLENLEGNFYFYKD